MGKVRARYFFIGIICIALIAAAIILVPLAMRYANHQEVEFSATESSFQIYKDGDWQDFTIKGVNMGAGKPGTFPGEMSITKDEYARWFDQISEMNANTIRVYTIHPPEFYQALFEHNLYTDNPIYLFHGVWMNEEAMLEYYDAYTPEITYDMTDEIERMIDILHGRTTLEERAGHASGSYRWDVSNYVIGYILGIEVEADFVLVTNGEHPDITSFEGMYLHAEDASPYECWLARIGDHAISYEMDNYDVQRPISWTNWSTTDPLEHSNEPDAEQEDAVPVDIEHIHATDLYTAGLFATYHAYPYYPEFMMYQPEYVEYVDSEGEINPYEAFLKDLQAHHSMPVLIGEFGLPSSRGKTHENTLTDYNQGFLTEEQQGEYAAKLYRSILASDCAGGLVFSWQDEWFKRSWNTMDFDIAENRPFWSNIQSSEQSYGLLSFDPGEESVTSHVDGDQTEWDEVEPSGLGEGIELSAQSDERYLYLRIKDEKFSSTDSYVLAIDSIDNQGNFSHNDLDLDFSIGAEFALVIDGEENSFLQVDSYYDTYYRFYNILEIVEDRPDYEVKDSGIFNPINLFLRRSVVLPLTWERIPVQYYETGKLRHGISNPDSDEYDSLADFYIDKDDGCIEIRLPWQILNIADPSSKTAIGDIYEHEVTKEEGFLITPESIESFTFELFALSDSSAKTLLGEYAWSGWEMPTYHERLKDSYYILQGEFAQH